MMVCPVFLRICGAMGLKIVKMDQMKSIAMVRVLLLSHFFPSISSRLIRLFESLSVYRLVVFISTSYLSVSSTVGALVHV